MAFYGIFAALCINDVNFFIFYSIDVNVHTSHFSGGGFCVMNFLKRIFRKRQFLFFKTLFYPVSPWSDGRKTYRALISNLNSNDDMSIRIF